MILPTSDNPYNSLNLSVFNHNLSLPRHRWYEFKEGFSEKLVEKAIDEFSCATKRKPNILDPFSGSGTTLVTAGRLGLSATGIEVNPFLAFAAKAKCAPTASYYKSFHNKLVEILHESRHETPSPLEGISTFTENSGASKWLYNRSVLRGYTSIERAIKKSSSRYRGALKLVLFASLTDCCNAKKDGKCLRYKKNWETLGFTSSELRNIFEQRALQVFEDISQHDFDKSGLRLVSGDCRKKLKKLEKGSFDLIVTSPPYLNSFDYSDVYRPELFVGGFVKTNNDLRNIRLRTLRSHVQVNWKPSKNICSPMIPPIIEKMSEKNLWNKQLPHMVVSYFTDMEETFAHASQLMRPGGQAWIVVSTSAYGGVEIPVDLILADIATRSGWRLNSVNTLRQLRAAGQHNVKLGAGAKLPLRESLIILERE